MACENDGLKGALNRKLRIKLAKLGFNTLFKRHHGIRTATAMSNETERNRLAFHAYEFKISTILLEHGTESLKHCLNLFFERHFISPEIEKPVYYTKLHPTSQQTPSPTGFSSLLDQAPIETW
jgi:hypothetical protein